MKYRLYIVDNQPWMYVDMLYCIIDLLGPSNCDYSANIDFLDLNYIGIYLLNLTKGIRNIYIGTGYKNIGVPDGSIITNFDIETSELNYISHTLLHTCEVWDFNQINIDLYKSIYPEGIYRFLKLGYSPMLEISQHLTIEKSIDVLFLGGQTPRRSKILWQLEQKGLVIRSVYRKNGLERNELYRKSKIFLNIYSSDYRKWISSTRLTPALSNSCFIVTEECANKEENDIWSQYTISVNYHHIVDTILHYIKHPESISTFVNDMYPRFKQMRTSIS